MLPKKSLVTLILFFLLFVVINQSAFGQPKLASCSDIERSRDFYLLGTTAGELNSEIQQLEADLKNLQSQLPKAIPAQKIDEYKKELDQLQQKANMTASEETRVKILTLQLQNAVSVESLNEKIAQANKDLTEKKELSRCVQQKLSSMNFSPEQLFKFSISLAFALLIGGVILGFFILSNKDEFMRRAIFAGQTGIQFLTLFSIVIAIILFGITGILADKELAALLGGISGYILGRSSTAGGPTEPSFLDRLVSITITPDAVTLTAPAPTAPLKIVPKDKNGNVIKDDSGVFKPTWTSSNPAVATVDDSGLITRVAVGTCNVTASFKGITSNPCAVTCS